MSRERDAIELIWKEIESVKSNWPKQVDWCNSYHARIEQILTQMEDLIQEDLEQMERSSIRSRETLKTNPPSLPGTFENKLPPSRTCPLLEEYRKSQEATNTGPFWAHPDSPATIVVNLEDYPAEGDTYSPI